MGHVTTTIILRLVPSMERIAVKVLKQTAVSATSVDAMKLKANNVVYKLHIKLTQSNATIRKPILCRVKNRTEYMVRRWPRL